jgi:hypothetical protein
MSTRPFVNDIFKLKNKVNGDNSGAQGEWINIYTGQEVIQDKYEQNVVVNYNNPLPIIAIVNDLTAAQANWKMPGIEVAKIKEVMIMKKYRSLIELSQKIEIEGEMYEGWRVNGKMQIRSMAGNILRLYVYIKVT